MTLSSLAPRRGELLWDIGAGAGSVAIEWMLADPSMRAIAIEQRAERAARIHRNAAAFGVPGLEIVDAAAPAALAGLAAARRHFHRRRRQRDLACSILQSSALAFRRPARGQCGDARNRGAAHRASRRARRRADSHRASRGPAQSAAKPAGEPAMPVTQWVNLDETMIVAGDRLQAGRVRPSDIEAAIRAALCARTSRVDALDGDRHHRGKERRDRHPDGGEKIRRVGCSSFLSRSAGGRRPHRNALRARAGAHRRAVSRRGRRACRRRPDGAPHRPAPCDRRRDLCAGGLGSAGTP